MIIYIKKLKVSAIFGLYGHERRQSRDLFISAKITIDGEKASETDKIEDSLDYDKVCQLIINETQQTKFYMLERLAAHLIQELGQIDKRIKKIRIKIDKPGAVKEAESVGVILERKSN